MNMRALAAEAIGTFILLTFGFLAVATVTVVTEGQGGFLASVLVVPLAFGLGLLTAIAIGGHVSGGHFNPAVTLAAVFDGRVTWQSGIGYVVAQILGGIVAALGVMLVTSQAVIANAANAPGATGDSLFANELHAFSVEAVLTALFVAVILTVTIKQPDKAIIVIPLTLAGIHYAAMAISGASVNPVRSLAPAVVSGNYASLWVYLTGPFVGSVLGWGIYRLLTPEENEISIEIEEELDDDELEELLEDASDDDDDDDELAAIDEVPRKS
jgi:aquaporin Z